MTRETPELDVDKAQELAAQAVTGREGAYPQLVEILWPELLRAIAGSRLLDHSDAATDHVHNIATRIVDKLQQDDCRSLRLFPPWKERHPDKDFGDWLRIVTRNATRDYARASRGRTKSAHDAPSLKQLINEFATSIDVHDLGARPPWTAAQTARQLFEFAERRLPEQQILALREWLAGASFEEIHHSLELGNPTEARNLVRAAVSVLRRHFTGQD